MLEQETAPWFSPLGSVPESPGEGTPWEGTPSSLEGAQPEVEAKFLIEDAGRVGDLVDSLDSYDVRSASVVDVVDDYWDTPDWHLFSAGWAYRWRDCSGDKSMVLKSFKLGDGIVQRRREIECRVPAFPRDGSHPLVAEHVAGRSGGLRSGDLRRLFRVQTHRRLFGIRLSDGALVEVGIDQTTITAVGPVKKPAPGRMGFVDLEVKLKEGGEESLRQLAAETQQRFGLLAAHLSKFERGLLTAGLSPPRATQVGLPVSAPYVEALREPAPAPADPARAGSVCARYGDLGFDYGRRRCPTAHRQVPRSETRPTRRHLLDEHVSRASPGSEWVAMPSTSVSIYRAGQRKGKQRR